ncbi:MAG: adenosylcobinamide-phosphate synthase CbiB [Spirochaetaceae bacterium]|jgi:adenosylcobinamide-phosphate synthase|nr:adenosylcobinamide-phosphate synthase CbiB [Spirochaetaceae bacterium]
MSALFLACPLAAGFLLDLLFGDPPEFPHIVRLFGFLISKLEFFFRGTRLRGTPVKSTTNDTNHTNGRTDKTLFVRGIFFCAAVLLISAGAPACLLYFAYRLHPAAGCVLETLLVYQLIAVKDLRVESLRVFSRLEAGDIEGARRALSMIVGRDTKNLDEAGVARAAVETVAENSSDGAAAPLFFIALGGAAAGCLYKAANTMDSMIGYKNERYLYFGRAAARVDDLLNLAPSRLSALLMIAASVPLGFDARGAARVWRRDKRKHASPNSAQTEAACAGALGLRLAGPAFYEGALEEKPFIGDETRSIERCDIIRANRLHYAASMLMLLLAFGIRIVILSLI